MEMIVLTEYELKALLLSKVKSICTKTDINTLIEVKKVN